MYRTHMYASVCFIKIPPPFLVFRSRYTFSSVMLGNPREVSWINYIFFSDVLYGFLTMKNSQWIQVNLMHSLCQKRNPAKVQGVPPPA